MNLLHLKYAVEIDCTKSISKAAENLYMGQPNLSRAIKELEEKFGVSAAAPAVGMMMAAPTAASAEAEAEEKSEKLIKHIYYQVV